MSTRAQPSASSEGIDNFQLPKALVTRIAKSVLPPEAKLQKDAINAFVNGASVFINFLAATAQDVAASRSRKTIAGPDILKALEIIELGDLVPSLQRELESYRSLNKADKGKGTATGADVKGKGKEKEDSPVSLTTLPGNNVYDSELLLAMMGNTEEQEEGDIDEDVRMAGAGTQEYQEEVKQEVEEEVEQEEEDEEEEEEEEEEVAEEVEDDGVDEPEDEVVDMLGIEEEELEKDTRGLENSTP